jgi:hypothetical protein
VTVSSDTGAGGSARATGAAQRHELLLSGVVSGVLGGVAMLVVAGIAAALQDVDPLRPLEIMGETFLGPDALERGAKIALGGLLHLVVAAALGVLFAALAPREYAPGSAMGLGVGFGLFTAGLMMTALVPWVNPGFREGIQVIGGSWVVAHAVFGLVVGAAPALRRRLSAPAAGAASPVRAPGAAPAHGGARSS